MKDSRQAHRKRSPHPLSTWSDLAHEYHLGTVLRVFAPHPTTTLFWAVLGGMSLLVSGLIALLTIRKWHHRTFCFSNLDVMVDVKQ